MRRQPDEARLLALVVREIADREPEAWTALLVAEFGQPGPLAPSPKKEGALIPMRRRGGARIAKGAALDLW